MTSLIIYIVLLYSDLFIDWVLGVVLLPFDTGASPPEYVYN